MEESGKGRLHIRKHLNRIYHEQLFIDESFIALVCKVEAPINSRSLTNTLNTPYLEPFTPNHLLPLKMSLFFLKGVFDPSDVYSR